MKENIGLGIYRKKLKIYVLLVLDTEEHLYNVFESIKKAMLPATLTENQNIISEFLKQEICIYLIR